MPVPKRKRSRARRDKRFANKGINVKAFTHCANCQAPLATHQACTICGFYKGVKVMKTKLDRVAKRGEQKKTKKQETAQIEQGQQIQEK